MTKMKVFAAVLAVVLLVMTPLFLQRDAEFGGSDDGGSQVVAQVDSGYTPWASPLIENILGRELPGEVESLFFCVQTGIGVGIIAFVMGRLVERKKWMDAKGNV